MLARLSSRVAFPFPTALTAARTSFLARTQRSHTGASLSRLARSLCSPAAAPPQHTGAGSEAALPVGAEAREEPPLSAAAEGEEALPTGPRRGPRPEDRPRGDTSRKYVYVDEKGRAYSTGGRKTASASVWVWETEEVPTITVNDMNLSDWLRGHWAYRLVVMQPFLHTNTVGKYSVKAYVKGGGLSGQAEAVRHGIATAMQGLNFDLRPTLKAAGFLTRDPRRRERKKPGQTGARKKWAWVKR
ncbi:hypothetical protein AB1Y20_002076 [Prymnesium parvum]|uniref:30S ribosomal protein S9, chloroplastic n=1 Tax=Prymnesium parvum TaxID=97485 RepID=A0AB34J9Y8_PRYPA